MSDLLGILQNVVEIIPDFEALIVGSCYVIGLLFVIMAIRGAARREALGPGQGGYGPHLVRFAIGVSFIALPTTVQVGLATVFGSAEFESPQAIFQYAPESTSLFDTGPARDALIAIVTVVQFVGVIGFIRGLFLLNAASTGTSQVRSVAPGLTFVIAGILAINAPLFIGAMENLVTR
ncbi:hypothetical protein [Amorphus sp. 3PC139-8]|uniref:hypothetical protein n=1 Tax=Amorphus sp. 3PC139-8 TaxID=2735676 RepID=UPI00345DEFC4